MKTRDFKIFVFLVAIVLIFTGCGSGGGGNSTTSAIQSGESQITSNSPVDSRSTDASSKKDFKKSDKSEYVQGEILVKFKSHIKIRTAGDVNRKVAEAGLAATVKRSLSFINTYHLEITDQDVTVEEAINKLKSNPDIEYAEPNYIVKEAAIPNDTYFSYLWGLNNTGQTGGTTDADIDAPEAWDVTTGSSNIVIAVIDSGVAYNHPDLIDNIWRNTGETNCSDGIDNDSNGYIDDCYGWDFIDNDGYPEDYESHGTHVAGTIAAKGNNATGITGVMWTAKIMPIRFLGVSGSGDTANAAAAILYAVNNGARVINASWGGGGYSQTLYNAIDYARSKNALFVTASGNETNNNDISPSYPASYNLSNIISVAATDNKDSLAYFSNYGANSVHLAAPGVSIYSSIPVFTYGTPVTIYSQNFDIASGSLPLLGWSRGGTNSTWAVTAGTGVSSTNSLEDSPSSNYQSNTNSWAGYMTPVTSVKNNRYTLSFKWKGYVDTSTNDYLNINYSSNGAIWDWIDWTDGNTGGNFVDYSTTALTAGADLYNSFYFGFGLESDASGNYDGAYIDDVSFIREPITISGYSYTSYDGTSMAAPHVSGVAGLILSVNSALTYSQVKDIILNTVDKKSSLSGKTLTGGRLNAFAAVSGAVAPNTPSNLTASAISDTQVDLNWADNSSNETGFKIERKTGADGTYTQIATAGANVTTYSDTGLSASTTYYYRVEAYNSAGDSSYSNEAGAMTQASSGGDSGGGGGGGCFIATAAYGSYLAPEVKILRQFRDEYLITNTIGKIFVEFYYSVSPPIAAYIARHEGLRLLARLALTPFVYSIKYSFVSVIFAGLIVVFVRYKRTSLKCKIKNSK